jgi:hypothetical protein
MAHAGAGLAVRTSWIVSCRVAGSVGAVVAGGVDDCHAVLRGAGEKEAEHRVGIAQWTCRVRACIQTASLGGADI